MPSGVSADPKAEHLPRVTLYAWLSIGAALVTIGLKTAAYLATNSVGLLSDALESGVNLVAAVVTLLALRIALRPPDREHEFGHDKAEYFASGVEGAMIFVAALVIVVSAVWRLWVPADLESLGLGMVVSAVASVVNLVVARVLLRAARRHHSIALEADGDHLMTDVWTSAGVIAAVAIVAVTGWSILDPLIAIAVALNILRIGARLLHRSGMGLLDTTIAADERRVVVEILDRHAAREGTKWRALRTRQAGARRFVDVHVLVPGSWSVQRGHELCDRIEAELEATRIKTNTFTHLEPMQEPSGERDLGAP